jgi:hypothetical protein
LNEITDQVDVLLYHNYAVAVEEILFGHLRGQVHPVLDQIDIIDEHVFVEGLLARVLFLAFLVDVNEVL